MTDLPLSGRRIVVTRPAGQARHLVELIRQAGGESVLFPVIEIRDASELAPALATIERLDSYDLAVFVSANAVQKGMALVRARRDWPAGLAVATVGRGSERELKRQGFAAVIAPTERFDSEALLELPALQEVAGQSIVIFRGEGGREFLADALAERGAAVDYVECYRRVRPETDPAPLVELWARGALDALCVTSSEGMENLVAMLDAGGRSQLAATPVFVPHERIADRARALGVRTAVATAGGDEGLIAGLCAFFAKV